MYVATNVLKINGEEKNNAVISEVGRQLASSRKKLQFLIKLSGYY